MPPYPLADPALLAEVAEYLTANGWQPVWCPQRQNGSCTPSNNPSVTGYDAPYPTVLPQPPGPHRLGFRVPPSLVIIDVDHYEGKQGAHTLDRAEEYLGPLPPTYKVTARGMDDPSGRFIFRKPVDLDFSNSALNQFANDNGKTDIDILRTGHRFSWAPGDLNHKNHQPVQCYDPDGVICLMPAADDPSIPSLPQRWIDYLRNPPKAYSSDAYVRPADGPQWWLAQPDNSISTDDALSKFAYSMMVSCDDMEVIYEQWQRVSQADDPSWPWDREDFDRHTRPHAQEKAAREVARQEDLLNSLPASRSELDQIEERNKQEAVRDQRIQEVISQHNLFPVQPLDQDIPQGPRQTLQEYVGELVRGYPNFTEEIKRSLIRKYAEKDVAELMSTPFTGYKQIGQLPEPSPPETLQVRGKDSTYSSVVPRGAVTVISGHRASGKTWVTATWAAQELRAGNVVFWVDFERQDRALTSKLRMLGVPEHMIDNQLRYTDALPPAEVLLRDVQQAGESGTHRVMIVVDAWRALQNRVMPGTGSNDGDAVEQVYTEYLTPLALLGGANIVLIDHMAKAAGTSAPASTIGAERKESAADYVILVDQTVPFSKKDSGFSTLTLTKVRGGEETAGTAVGYLWVPGENEDTSDAGITKYPRQPELRNWAPECVPGLGDMNGEPSDKAKREAAILSIVRDNRLQLGPRPLGMRVFEVYPDLFASAKSATDLASRMRTDGKLVKEDGKDGKYDVPEATTVMEVREPAPKIDPSVLEHPEG